MTLNKKTKILIVGLGVIGGGYAAALTRAGYSVSCITKDEKDIEYAKAKGIIKYGTTKLDGELIRSSELIIFALYPTIFIDWIEKNQALFGEGTLITDVTGVKGTVVEKVQSILRPDVEFIAAHPMAGRERSGVEYSDPDVFIGANYIVTPTEKNTCEAIDVCKRLGEILGFGKISELSCREHDEMIAYLSQLTHCIAVTLMTADDTPELEKYTGDSFRDLTRIAKINDRMWSELFVMNKAALLEKMEQFLSEFNKLKNMIEKEDIDGMRDMMRRSTVKRTSFDKR